MPSITWKCPSNIALVKYWGKKGKQLPANPSVSFTLNNCHTITNLKYEPKEEDGTLLLSFSLDGKPMPSFEPKLEQFFNNVEHLFPFLPGYIIEINTINTFPHSSGIASSASGFGALALCLCSMEQQLGDSLPDNLFFEKASNAARLGSGSASRSVYGPLAVWGKSEFFEESHDEHAIKLNDVHEVFKTYCDTILLVDEGKKEVSSTLGHSLLNQHPFAQIRYSEANTNLGLLKTALQTGDLNSFNEIVEKEAMMLHALMMTSNPAFILMKPNTLAIIQKVWEQRKIAGINMTITLDAGANVHLLYPHGEKEVVQAFIRNELSKFCKDRMFINDFVGLGPEQIEM
jgi:diphosphomevalonate decarboxylase